MYTTLLATLHRTSSATVIENLKTFQIQFTSGIIPTPRSLLLALWTDAVHFIIESCPFYEQNSTIVTVTHVHILTHPYTMMVLKYAGTQSILVCSHYNPLLLEKGDTRGECVLFESNPCPEPHFLPIT